MNWNFFKKEKKNSSTSEVVLVMDVTCLEQWGSWKHNKIWPPVDYKATTLRKNLTSLEKLNYFNFPAIWYFFNAMEQSVLVSKDNDRFKKKEKHAF